MSDLKVRPKINVREEKNIHLDTSPVSLNILEKSTATAQIGNLQLTVQMNCKKDKRRRSGEIFSVNGGQEMTLKCNG